MSSKVFDVREGHLVCRETLYGRHLDYCTHEPIPYFAFVPGVLCLPPVPFLGGHAAIGRASRRSNTLRSLDVLPKTLESLR